jgi:hypothetical protein
MKKLLAIIVSFLFMLPSIGLHIDLKHCCGGVENIGISHQAAVAISECCDVNKTQSCENNLELVVPQHLVDASLANSHRLLYSTYPSKLSYQWPFHCISANSTIERTVQSRLLRLYFKCFYVRILRYSCTR